MKKEYQLVPGEIYYVYDTKKSDFAMLGRALGIGRFDRFGCHRSEAKFLAIHGKRIEPIQMTEWAYYHRGLRQFRVATFHEKRFFERWEKTGIIGQQITTSYLRWFLNHEKWK